MDTLGIDIGSASSKAVILRDGKELIAYSIIQLGTGSSGPKKVLEEVLEKAGIERQEIASVVATGYGRYSIDIAEKQISEISCHAKGVHFLFPNAKTILDIGGQDAKAISINDQGTVECFFMNEKCAAGTGRFLEVMAKILEISLDEMGEYDKLSKKPSVVSSTCTVFAESEVISQLSQGIEKEDLIRGVHNSVISRAAGLLYRTKMKEDFVFTGGVAKNSGVVSALEKELKRPVFVSEYAQLTGAIGAAIYAFEEAMLDK